MPIRDARRPTPDPEARPGAGPGRPGAAPGAAPAPAPRPVEAEEADGRAERSEGPAWRDGAVAALPLLLGALPFGLVAGVSAVAVGLPPFEAIAMGAVVFAGTSQLAGLQLISEGAPAGVIVATTVLINLRLAMYSASLAGPLRVAPRAGRTLAAYLLTDQAFALATLRYRERPESPRRRLGYFVGAGALVWAAWMVTTAVGALLGAGLPASWRLDFAVPLMFLTLLVPAVRSRAELVAALVGAAVALAARDLPMNLGLMAGALAGVTAGVVASGSAGGGAAPEAGAGGGPDEDPRERP